MVVDELNHNLHPIPELPKLFRFSTTLLIFPRCPVWNSNKYTLNNQYIFQGLSKNK
jgi:hypothetical protein